VQLFGQLAFVSGGTVKGVSDLSTPAALAARKLPVLTSVGPLAAAGGGQLVLTLRGRHLASPDTVVVVKAGGKHLYLGPGRLVASPGGTGVTAGPAPGACKANCGCVSSQPRGRAGAAAAGGAAGDEQVVEVVVGAAPVGPQLVWVEVACGSYHTPPVPLLLVQDEAVVQVRSEGLGGGGGGMEGWRHDCVQMLLVGVEHQDRRLYAKCYHRMSKAGIGLLWYCHRLKQHQEGTHKLCAQCPLCIGHPTSNHLTPLLLTM
jgi:hypothetical protein